MKRKILSLILVFAMTVSLLTVGTGAVELTYGDTAGHWAESSIERWSAYGIIRGSNGQFDPNGQLTCAQLATILAKLLKLPAAKDAGFTDNTADAWYYDAINRCAAAGILNGNGDGTVTPEAPISRERAMVMLARALGIEPISKPDLTKYTDAAKVAPYAQGYVAAMIEAGIVGGVTADELAPQDNINRASTVTILDRAISTYADKAGATVKADGKGIVLVVAENVKITGAPEGTKIVVADGATGLTVNGKSVSDDQTYIVPKTTTGSGSSSGGYSHSHSYNETTHKCSCGAFAPAVVATIGNTNGYLTLEAAVAAAQSGDIVKLLDNEVVSATVTVDKNLTLDLGGNTLTGTNCRALHITSGKLDLTGTGTVKSTGIAVNSSVVRVGDDSGEERNVELVIGKDVVIESPNSYGVGAFGTVTTEKLTIYGTIKSTAPANGPYDGCAVTTLGTDTSTLATIIIKEAAKISATNTNAVYLPAGSLTVEGGEITGTTGIYFKSTNMTISGGTITGNGEAKNYEYYGNGGISTGEAVTIDSCNYPGGIGSVSIRGGKFSSTHANAIGSYNSNNGLLQTNFVTGGTFSTEPDDSYIAEGYEAKNNGNGTWTVGEKTGVTLVAQVGVNKYESLADALAAAKSGDTVKLVSNTTLTSSVEINKSITLDLNGKTIRYTGKNQKTANPTMSHRALNVTSGTVTIKNGAITTTVVGTIYPPQDNPQAEGSEFDAIIVKSGAVVTLEDMNITINDKYGSCLYVFEGGKATVKSGSYTNTNMSGDKLLLNQKDLEPQAIFVEGGTFDGRNPKIGDNSGNPSTFLAEGYEAVGNEGKWTVKPIFAGGTGTAEDPFVIQNAEQFKAFRDNVNAGNTFAGKTIELTADIDLSSVENWVPIGNESGKAFAGTFDGNNKTISNLKITSGGYIGLFGYVDGGAAIKNVNLVGANVSGTERVGGLIGEIIGNTTVSNCSIDETSHISGTDSNTGGLIGAAINGTAISLSGLTNRASVTNTQPSTARAGGIIGQVTTNANVTITDCHNEGAVTATGGYAGGIVSAYQHGALTINRCANSGTLTGAYKGNLVAWITSVRSLSISVQDANVEKMIGLLDKDYKRNITINGTAYFLNEKDDPFTFESALGDKELLDTVKIDKIIDFYRFAKTKNQNFVNDNYPETYWDMFDKRPSFGGDGWPQLLAQYNSECGTNLSQDDFNFDFSSHIAYYIPAES